MLLGDRHNLIDTSVDQLEARVATANQLFKTGKSTPRPPSCPARFITS